MDKDGTIHTLQPQVWNCRDIFFTVDPGDIVIHMNGEPGYSQIDERNRQPEA